MNPLHRDGSEVGMKEEAELSSAQPFHGARHQPRQGLRRVSTAVHRRKDACELRVWEKGHVSRHQAI